MIMYNREPLLPTDVKCNLNKNGNSNGNQGLFDFAIFDVVLSSATKVRASVIDDLSGNIRKSPKKNKSEILIVGICQKPRFM